MLKQKGFTLIEIMIAIFVIVVGVVGMYSLVPHVLQMVGLNYDKFIATQLAAEGIEIVRNIREGNWLEQIDTPANDWFEDLDACDGLGCEIDYTLLGQVDPSSVAWALGGRFLKINNDGFYQYTAGADSKFKRKITISPTPGPAFDDNTYALDVSAEVFWGSETVQVREIIYNWR